MRPYLECPDHRRQEVLAALARSLAARPQVVVALVFGSFLDGKQFRDIDVGVLVDPGQVPEEVAANWAWDLATDLELATGFPVDLTVLNYAPVALRYHASLGRPLVSKDETAWGDFLERTWDEYLDFEPFLRASLRDLLVEGGDPPAG